MLRARLRTRILVSSFVPTTIILFAVALTIYYAYQRVTEDLVVGRNQQLIHLSAGQLAADLNAYVNTLTSLAHSADIYNGDPLKQSAALSQSSNQLMVFDGGTLILDPLGKVVTTQPEQPDLEGQDWSNRIFFRQILHNGVPTFSDIIPGGKKYPEVLAVAVPILNDKNEFRGTLVGMFQLGAGSSSAFYGGIVKLRLGESGSTYLVDNTGRVIYHPDDRLIGSDWHDQADVQQVLKGQMGYLRMHNSQGLDILATFAPVPGTPWSLINEESWASLLASSRGYGQFLYLLLGLGVVIPTLVVLFGVKRITDPVAQLMAAAQEITAGKYGQQISVHTGDELEELGEQFNLMSVQLQESYAQLEQRVAARTKELATLNAIAEVASRSLNLDEILNDALHKILEVLEMQSGAAYALTEEGNDLQLLAHCSLSQEFVDRISLRPIKGSVVEQAVLKAYPIVWRLEDYPEGAMKPWLSKEGIEQVICIPLLVKARLVGAFLLGARETRPMTPEELSLLSSIGQQIGVAVENAHLYKKAEQTAAIAERTRLARELHDSVTQSLYSVTLFAKASASLLAKGDYATAAAHLHELGDTAREALQEMRLLIFQLRTPALENKGIAAALQARLESVEMRGGIKSELHVEGVDHLPLDIQQELYHIAQETLNNTLKHAHAGRVDVFLSFSEGCVKLQICDDGTGFDPANLSQGGLGLAGMRERAQRIGGNLLVESGIGQGTKVTVLVQLRPQDKEKLLEEGE